MTRPKKPDPAPAAEPGPEKILVSIPRPLLGIVEDLAATRGTPRQHVILDALERGVRAIGGAGVEPGLEDDLAAWRRTRVRLDQALEDVELSEAEASLVCDAMNGVMALVDHSPDGYSAAGHATMVYAEVSDACSLNGAHEKWGVDRKALLSRLRRLTPVQGVALAEATRRFWSLTDLPTTAALRACGLVRA